MFACRLWEGSTLSEAVPDIVVAAEPLEAEQLRTLVARFFVDMVKLVVDIERAVVAIGGELHADAEAILLEQGSRQIEDPVTRSRVRDLVFRLVGQGEPLA